MPDETSPKKNPRLWDDIGAVEGLAAAGDLDRIRAILTDHRLSDNEILESVPLPLLRLAAIFGRPDYAERRDRLDVDLAAKLDRAREFVERELPDLVSHRVTKMIVERAQRTLASRPDSVQEIAVVNSLHSWLGSPPDLFPASRLILNGPQDQILFDYVTGLDDLIFLTASISRAVAALLHDAAELHRLGVLREIPQVLTVATQPIREALDEIDRYLSEVTTSVPTPSAAGASGDEVTTPTA